MPLTVIQRVEPRRSMRLKIKGLKGSDRSPSGTTLQSGLAKVEVKKLVARWMPPSLDIVPPADGSSPVDADLKLICQNRSLLVVLCCYGVKTLDVDLCCWYVLVCVCLKKVLLYK